MKKSTVFLVIISFFVFSKCNAEKIYCKDGTVIDGIITRRSSDSLWIKHGPGSLGINLRGITKIQNDDGSISKYDYVSLCKIIQKHIKEHNFKEALNNCNQLLGSFPEDTQIIYLRGLLHQVVGNSSEAAKDYNFLITKNSADSEIFNNLGVIYAKNKQDKKAQDLFVEAIADKPDMAEAHSNLADIFLQNEQFARAIDEYNKVINSEPNNTKALYNLGLAYARMGDNIKARAQWEKVIAITPDDNRSKSALEYLKAKQ